MNACLRGKCYSQESFECLALIGSVYVDCTGLTARLLTFLLGFFLSFLAFIQIANFNGHTYYFHLISKVRLHV